MKIITFSGGLIKYGPARKWDSEEGVAEGVGGGDASGAVGEVLVAGCLLFISTCVRRL